MRLRAAVEAVPPEQLDAPARTYLRTAPLLTRTQAPAILRAALLETAFVEDGLPEYAAVLRRMVPELPWHTLWSAPVAGVDAVTVATLPPSAAASDGAAEAAPLAVAVSTVPQGTPGSSPLQADDPKAPALLVQDLATGSVIDAAPTQLLRPSDDERATGPLGFSRGADYVRVWRRGEQKGDEKIVTALISATPFTATDLSPDGILLVATESGVKALRIRPAQPYATTAGRSVPDPGQPSPGPHRPPRPSRQPHRLHEPPGPMPTRPPDTHPPQTVSLKASKARSLSKAPASDRLHPGPLGRGPQNVPGTDPGRTGPVRPKTQREFP